MTDDEPQINVDNRDRSGEVEMRKLLSDGRVSLPERFYRFLGIETGQQVLVVCEDDRLEIIKASKENILGEK